MWSPCISMWSYCSCMGCGPHVYPKIGPKHVTALPNQQTNSERHLLVHELLPCTKAHAAKTACDPTMMGALGYNQIYQTHKYSNLVMRCLYTMIYCCAGVSCMWSYCSCMGCGPHVYPKLLVNSLGVVVSTVLLLILVFLNLDGDKFQKWSTLPNFIFW